MAATETATSVTVRRYFPIFEFVVSTAEPRDLVISKIAAAMNEISSTTWPLPKAHLSGSVDGGTFACRPRTSAFGGNAVPHVYGQIVPRDDGGTDVNVRVVNWFEFILFGVFIVAGTAFAIHAETGTERVQSLGMVAWTALVGSAVYAAESCFVRGIFKRIVSHSWPAA